MNFETLPLGKNVKQPLGRNVDVLFPIPRSRGREAEKLKRGSEFGFDLWNLWELSWLNEFGVPRAYIGRLKIPIESENICESKSLKLYLNGLSYERFSGPLCFKNQIVKDLSSVLGVKPDLEIYSLSSPAADIALRPKSMIGFGMPLDEMSVRLSHYLPDERLLEVDQDSPGNASMYTQLFRSKCPVTEQPDWATIGISYSAKKTLNPASFLAYLISFRNHSSFHEACIERIFNALALLLEPKLLIVWGAFTRRGGLDINPVRTSSAVEFILPRFLRQ